MRKMVDAGVLSPGHEGVGKIVAIGPNVPESLGLKIGDRAGIKPVYSSCDACLMCTTDREMYCKASKQTGLDTVSPTLFPQLFTEKEVS
jgi:alcohol dehydrogenase, propanol-preferring